MDQVKLSVIIPMQEYIGECLHHVMEQDIDAMEILCVDVEGTSDAIRKKVQKMSQKDTRIRILTSVWQGGMQLNVGLQAAKGVYVAFPGVESILGKQMYREMIKLADRNSLDVIFCRKDAYLEEDRRDLFNKILDSAMDAVWQELPCTAGSMVCRRAFLLDQDIVLPEDVRERIPYTSLWLQALLSSHRTYIVSEASWYQEHDFLPAPDIGAVHREYEYLLKRLKKDEAARLRWKGIYSRYAIREMRDAIERADALDRKVALREISKFFHAMHESKMLDYYALDKEDRKFLSKVMFIPDEYGEDLLLGKTPRMAMEFIFPYHLFPRDSKVIIYGGGNVGRLIYRQAKKDGYVDIVVVVDQNGVGRTWEDTQLHSVAEIANLDYDYVLLAIRDEKTAMQAKEMLTLHGVAAYKILWDGKVYFRNDFYKELYLPLLDGWTKNRAGHERFLKDYRTIQEGYIHDHVFPYHLFHEGEKVVVYGAGDIGTKFWKQGKRDGFVKLVGIVDREAQKLSLDIPVMPVNKLEEIEFDSVLISVHGPEEIIEKITQSLENIGVARDKIKWDGRTYHQNEFRRNVYLNMVRAIGSDFETSAQMLGRLCRRIDAGIYEHVFPYSFFERGEHIAIYGAGKVGQDLYRQARKYGYVDVEVIADQEYEKYDIADVPISSVETLKSLELDAILIAEENEEEAEVAREELLQLGIAQDKILWDCLGYGYASHCQEYLQKLADRTEEELAQGRKDGAFRMKEEN